jgi:predicted transcriptional regulator
MDKEDITKKIEESHGINLNNNEIQYVLSNMCKLGKINDVKCGTRLGYKLKIE